ncbi:FAD-binding protein [Desulfallas sp. Bu1-1]|uniref:FAD-binding oxidoreductase n=1 Tax=Desulfallas sp. Bu1-1 TaxID=2787620 RepID=UPI0018A088F4|nr:FAD-linked oxidase C-terminal domain-containing protein [Desulfallas sp. Bu1-1]MBF7082773.1 FAD-binding protein [Desulfallas sp. Bu1-1]
MIDNLAKEIAARIGKSKVTTAPEDLVCYSYDCSMYSGKPDIVVRVESKTDVIHVLKIASQKQVPVIARGAATSNCGAVIPTNGGIILDMLGMSKIIEIDMDNFIAVCEPGVITAHLQAEVEKRGLFYPPDPQGLSMSTIGGNVATGAGGPRAIKYGTTRDYILGLETVLADGEVLKTGGKVVKDVSGYNLTQLLIGSEGTLGVFTEIILKLIPLPETKRTLLCIFNTLEDASVAVTEILHHKVIPSMMELLDKTSTQLIQMYMDAGYPTDAEAILLIEVDGSNEDVEDQVVIVKKVCESCKARSIKIARTKEEEEAIWAGRKAGFAALSAYKPVVIPEDATVPRNLLPEMMRKVQDIAKKYDVLLPTFGHAGDGNVHPHICINPRHADELDKVNKIKEEIYREALNLGGTITGEHGVGIVKKELAKKQHSKRSLTIMTAIKKAFDPNNILNPGKAF